MKIGEEESSLQRRTFARTEIDYKSINDDMNKGITQFLDNVDKDVHSFERRQPENWRRMSTYSKMMTRVSLAFNQNGLDIVSDHSDLEDITEMSSSSSDCNTNTILEENTKSLQSLDQEP